MNQEFPGQLTGLLIRQWHFMSLISDLAVDLLPFHYNQSLSRIFRLLYFDKTVVSAKKNPDRLQINLGISLFYP
ncbi:MAG: hypothetical protein BA864_09360 [Desulfuromonadales bacterium C00003093]|nr:MAG: hypothetical protein BA864_09360 [Desulfuromonadales bacterium C00003093]